MRKKDNKAGANNSEEHQSSEEHQPSEVISTGTVSSQQRLSRRDFLKLAATALSASAMVPLLASCNERAAGPTATPLPTSTPSEPQVTINSPGVILLAHPGDYEDKVLYNNKEVVVSKGETAYVMAVDETGTWYKVKTKEGRVGWVEKKKVSISPGFEARMNAVPVVAERPPLPTPKPPPTSKPPDQPPSTIHYWYPN